MGPQLFLDGHDAFVNETLGDGGGVLDGFECGCLIERQVLHAQGSEEILILLVFARFKERGFKCADDFFRRALGRVHADTDADAHGRVSYFLESRRVRIGREAFLISDDHGYELWVVDVLKYDVDVVAEHGGDGLRPAVCWDRPHGPAAGD